MLGGLKKSSFLDGQGIEAGEQPAAPYSKSAAGRSNTQLRPAAVAFALGATICRLQVKSGFGQTGHRADKAE
jgi:hypothetical protein